MKLYLLDYYNQHNTLPEINKVLINSCMKIMCSDTEKKTGRPPKKEMPKKEIRELKAHLKEFYDKHYKPLCVPDESFRLCSYEYNFRLLNN